MEFKKQTKQTFKNPNKQPTNKQTKKPNQRKQLKTAEGPHLDRSDVYTASIVTLCFEEHEKLASAKILKLSE